MPQSLQNNQWAKITGLSAERQSLLAYTLGFERRVE